MKALPPDFFVIYVSIVSELNLPRKPDTQLESTTNNTKRGSDVPSLRDHDC